jgi:hypothetical protein
LTGTVGRARFLLVLAARPATFFSNISVRSPAKVVLFASERENAPAMAVRTKQHLFRDGAMNAFVRIFAVR